MKFTKKTSPWWQALPCARASRLWWQRSGRQLAVMPRSKRCHYRHFDATKSEERWNKDGNNLKAKLEKAGYKVILSFADDKPAQQNADIENMVNNDAKIVVVASKDGTAVGPAVEKARDAGAKVIAYDRLIMNTDAVDYYATFQLEQVGVLEATWLIDQLKLKDGATGPFNIELFTGSPDDNNAKYFFKALGICCSRTSRRACSSPRPSTVRVA